jgi:hypothetical protein
VLRLMLVETALPTSNNGGHRDVAPTHREGKNSREKQSYFCKALYKADHLWKGDGTAGLLGGHQL